MTTTSADNFDWAEYDSAAEWCAARGIKGEAGDRLPSMLSSAVYDAIADDPEAFQERVRETAYARANESRDYTQAEHDSALAECRDWKVPL